MTELGAQGTLWALHGAAVRAQVTARTSPPPDGFVPFAVGYVELPEGVKVEAVLDCDDFAELDGRARSRCVVRRPVPRFATDADARGGAPMSTGVVDRRRRAVEVRPAARTRPAATWPLEAIERGAGGRRARRGPTSQVAFGGSDGSGLADTLVADLGLTGIPFTNVKNGCATGGSALMSAVNAIRSGSGRHRPGRRLRQAPARRLRPAPGGLGPAARRTARPG